MATSVYSSTFVEVYSADVNAEYTVPTGFVVVVRDIAGFFQGSPEDTGLLVLNASTGVVIFYHLGVDEDEYVHWEGRQVIPDGSTLQAVSYGSNPVSVRICGYLLSR